MKWNSSDYRFPRPIRWIVSLLDDKVIEFEVASVKQIGLHIFIDL
jgi:Glycyl-tRNA synthetase, beta subunit